MVAKIYSAALLGIDAYEVEIEANVGVGDPRVVLVGLPDAAVKESVERVLAAMDNCGFKRPRGRTTVNLAPADLRKEGPGFDLPIALGMIAASEDEQAEINFTDFCIAGELALDGGIRRTRGALSLAMSARQAGRRFFMADEESAREASVLRGIRALPAGNLRQAYEILRGDRKMNLLPSSNFSLAVDDDKDAIDFAEVRGQEGVKRAFELAAAGGHNLLVIGPPGTGKSMLAKRLPGILPKLTEDEAMECAKIHSASGKLTGALILRRPFRAPHHTISDAGMLGGGSSPTPGEISLSHNGVLFMDELPEFRRSTLDALRQPLEDGQVTIARASASLTFPARFMLVAAMNPCPCGYYGDNERACRCSPIQVERYRSRVSGPVLDRVDIHVEAPRVSFAKLSSASAGESSADLRARVEAARGRQLIRLADSGVFCNADMTHKQIREYCSLDARSAEYLRRAMEDMQLSARAYDRILKLARTIADVENAEKIDARHTLEAIQYRVLDRNVWG